MVGAASKWPVFIALALGPGCTSSAPLATVEPAAGPAVVAGEPVAESWPDRGDCRELAAAVVALPAARRRALPAAGSPFALAVVERGLPLPRDTAAWLVAPDLPLPATTALAEPSPRCLIMVERAPTAAAAARWPLGHEVVGSTYHGGTRRSRNPDHAALKEAEDELERADSPAIMATGDPGIDLIGLIASSVLDGLDLVGRYRRADQLREARAATPAAVEETNWQPYTFSVATVQAERASYLRAALVDRVAGSVWSIAEPLREVKVFRIATGRHVNDRELIEHRAGVAVTEADVEVWEEGGLRLALGDLLARLTTAARAGGEGGAAGLAAAWARHSPPRGGALGLAAAGGRGRTVEPGAGPDPNSGDGTHLTGSLVRQEVLPDGTRRYRLVSPGVP